MRWFSTFIDWYCRRLGTWGIVPAIVLLIGASIVLPRLEFNPYLLTSSIKGDPYLERAMELRKRFTSPDVVTLSIPRKPDGDSLVAVRELSRALSSVRGVLEIVSVATVAVPTVVDGTFQEVPLVPDQSFQVSETELVSRVASDPLLSDLLMAPDGTAWNVLVLPNGETELPRFADDVVDAVPPGITVRPSGYPYYLARQKDYAGQDFRTLLILGVVAVLLAEFLILRNMRRTLLLWTTAVAAMVLVLGLYAVTGSELGIQQMVAPILVLVISTSYGVHVIRYWESTGTDLCRAAAGVAPIVITAGATTMMGFLSLVFSPVSDLRTLAGFSAIGVLMAVLIALMPFPCSLGLADSKSDPRMGQAALKPDDRANRKRWGGAGRLRTWCTVSVLILVTVAATGVVHLTLTAGPQHIFSRWSEVGRNIRYYAERYNSTSELYVYVETPQEYGLVDVQMFRAIEDAVVQIERREAVGSVVSYAQLVSWFWDRYATPVESRYTQAGIGESLELLASSDTVLNLDFLVDSSYRTTRILIRINDIATGGDIATHSRHIVTVLKSTLERYGREAEISVGGSSYETQRRHWYIMTSLLRGLILFFPSLFLFLWIVGSSLRFAFVVVIPPLASVAVYLGIAGWTGIPMQSTTAVGLAMVMGVAVDDAAYFGLYYRQRRLKEGVKQAIKSCMTNAGRAVVNTTAVIVAGLLPLFSSRFAPMPDLAILAIGTLSLNTAVVVYVMPGLLARFESTKVYRRVKT